MDAPKAPPTPKNDAVQSTSPVLQHTHTQLAIGCIENPKVSFSQTGCGTEINVDVFTRRFDPSKPIIFFLFK
jgi:hypothetical protein